MQGTACHILYLLIKSVRTAAVTSHLFKSRVASRLRGRRCIASQPLIVSFRLKADARVQPALNGPFLLHIQLLCTFYSYWFHCVCYYFSAVSS